MISAGTILNIHYIDLSQLHEIILTGGFQVSLLELLVTMYNCVSVLQVQEFKSVGGKLLPVTFWQ